jgi:fructose-1,6-bisphosphatase-3
MYLRRDEHLIFHGCVPADPQGNFLRMPIDGQELAGRPLFEAIDRVILLRV